MEYIKVETFIPHTHEESFITALNDAGLLKEGAYDYVYASSEVMGHWRPLEGANPFLGDVGEVSSEPELKLEFRIAATNLRKAHEIMKAEHPYEEPVFNFISLVDVDD